VQYDYLAHAVLALGASHLTVNTGADHTAQTLHHRMTALRLINERLSKPVESSAEGDALMGALICLAGQSSLIPDSVSEYVALTRGSFLVSQTVVLPMNRSIFRSITDSRHLDMLLSLFEEQPKDDTLIEDYQDYTESLAKICRKEHELQYQGLLYRSISLLPTKPLEGECLLPDPLAEMTCSYDNVVLIVLTLVPQLSKLLQRFSSCRVFLITIPSPISSGKITIRLSF
jgi:hypothetical protein